MDCCPSSASHNSKWRIDLLISPCFVQSKDPLPDVTKDMVRVYHCIVIVYHLPWAETQETMPFLCGSLAACGVGAMLLRFSEPRAHSARPASGGRTSAISASSCDRATWRWTKTDETSLTTAPAVPIGMIFGDEELSSSI